MKKIPTVFMRNHDTDKLVRNEVTPGCEWVLAGEGTPTRKWDGTCCRVLDGKLWKRYDAKKGKTPPPFFEPADDRDPETGHWPGWVPVGNGPEDQWFRAAFTDLMKDGTYELMGPHVQGNPEQFDEEILVLHGQEILNFEGRDFESLKAFLDGSIEGIVWHHPDGRMAKLKARDFGVKRKDAREKS